MNKLNIDQAIRLFAEFMNKSWSIVDPLLIKREYTTDDDSFNDWLQANWELLVERKVLKIDEYLESYGEGADFNAPSSRITMPKALPVFCVKVSQLVKADVYDSLNEQYCQVEKAEFVELVTLKKGFYAKEPIFNYVLIKDYLNIERVISIDDIQFQLCKIV